MTKSPVPFRVKLKGIKPSIVSLIFSDNDEILKLKIFDKPFRLKQIYNFIFKKNVYAFDNMSNLSISLRKNIEKKYDVLDIFPVDKINSTDGTEKYLFKLNDENCIESVILKDENERATFCISTQVGCRMGCRHCRTGSMGLIRNLNFTEIISQVLYLSKLVNDKFNIVFMGMGEPFDNFDNLIRSIEILTGSKYFNLSTSRITVSTCGIMDKITEFTMLFPNINLAVSLNSLIQEKREKIMPIAKKYNINELMSALTGIYKKNKKRITLEYVLIKEFNDGIDEINAFKSIDKRAFLINIIPVNKNDINLERPDESDIKIFCKKVNESGFNVTRRYKRGEDIKAACGQLYWDRKFIKEGSDR